MMIAHNFKPGFRVELHIKDLNNAMEAAGGVGAQLPLTQIVLGMMNRLRDEGKGANDHSDLNTRSSVLNGFTL